MSIMMSLSIIMSASWGKNHTFYSVCFSETALCPLWSFHIQFLIKEGIYYYFHDKYISVTDSAQET